MNAPRTEAIVRKRGEIRDHALYRLACELENAVITIIDARDRAALADDPAYYKIDRAIDNARKILGMNDESS